MFVHFPELNMIYRQFGKTGLRLSEIGYGAWGIGGSMWQRSDDNESLEALHTAIYNGITFIDTALAYGNGHSERLISRILKDRSEDITVATKIPPMNGKWPTRKGIPVSEVYPHEYIVKSTEKSLRNLGVETIDIQQLHVWSDEWLDEFDWPAEVRKLKESGKIKYFGVSVNDHDPGSAVRAVSTGLVDSVQVIYNIFDRSPEDELFDLCIKTNTAVIVRVPFDEGSLTGTVTPDTTFPKGDWRNNYFKGNRKKEVWERVKKLEPLLGKEAGSLAELALRFCLSHPAVSTVIPGMRTVQHVKANCAISDGRTLSKGLLDELKKHEWRRNFY
jgi:aryl-alcohol dehydrogenase-like predicted oxidoreductase